MEAVFLGFLFRPSNKTHPSYLYPHTVKPRITCSLPIILQVMICPVPIRIMVVASKVNAVRINGYYCIANRYSCRINLTVTLDVPAQLSNQNSTNP